MSGPWFVSVTVAEEGGEEEEGDGDEDGNCAGVLDVDDDVPAPAPRSDFSTTVTDDGSLPDDEEGSEPSPPSVLVLLVRARLRMGRDMRGRIN